jgi:hypothetical protein
LTKPNIMRKFLLIMLVLSGFLAQAQVTRSLDRERLLDRGELKASLGLDRLVDRLPAGSVEPFTEQFVASGPAGGFPEPIGRIDWQHKEMTAYGMVYLYPAHIASRGREYAVEMALRGADADGRANLLVMMVQARIFYTVRVVDQMLEKRVTVQVIEGRIMARRVGEAYVGKDFVRVTMVLSMSDNRGGLLDALGGAGLLADIPLLQGGLPPDRMEQARAEYREAGYAVSEDGALPGVIISLPKEKSQDLQPSLIPSIRVRDCAGRTQVVRYWGDVAVGNEQTQQIINATRAGLVASGLLDDVPVLGGIVRDGMVEVDLCAALEGIGSQDPRKAKRQEFWRKFGAAMLTMAPTLLALL